MSDVIAVIREVFPTAAIMNVEHAGRDKFTNADPIAVADTLNCVIGEAVDRLAITAVTLVGHSIGALLLRKAYVFARGLNQDSVSPVAPHVWAQRVDNMVFLAAFNRGINVLERTPGRSYARYYAIRFAYTLTRLMGVAKFVRRFERGGRFVSNLRLQWLGATPMRAEQLGNALAMYRPSGHPLTPVDAVLPPVTQLVGIEDEYIGESESNDVAVCGSFIRKNLPNTNHESIILFPDNADGEVRRVEFVKALANPDAVSFPSPPGAGIDRVIFVMHGIRDYGFWVPGLAKRIIQCAPGAMRQRIATITSSYGYFSMLAFILWSDRQRNVRWFMDQLTEAVARFPNARIDFVGHSNGTYLLASALRDYAATKFNNVVFAGSVVRRDFPWDSLKTSERVNAVRNYVASADWVVGWLPHFFEFLGDLLNRRELHYFDIGGAGFLGFTSTVTAKDQVTFIRGGHGAAVDPANWRSIARFIIDPTLGTKHSLLTDKQSACISLGSRLCWVVWGVAIVALLAIAVALGIAAFALSKLVVVGILAAFLAIVFVFLITESI
jgi:pimeloyl-ACP methyl ester carboxylesterase